MRTRVSTSLSMRDIYAVNALIRDYELWYSFNSSWKGESVCVCGGLHEFVVKVKSA